jgi:hypothetical protein
MCAVGRAEGGRRLPDGHAEVAQEPFARKAVKALRKTDCGTRHRFARGVKGTSSMRYTRMVMVTLVMLLVTNLGDAQEISQSDRQTIDQLVQQVKELQGRVRLLESERTAAPLASDPGPQSGKTETEAVGESAVQQPSVSEALSEIHGIQWRGFGEVNYKVLNQRKEELQTFGFVAGSAGNFYTGDFDLLLTSRINDKASVLSEIAFGENDAQSFGVDLERLLLKYDQNDGLKLSFGRYHTGIGYYNTAYHSGSWLQTTADRPLIMDFAADGGLLPTQAIGVSATGIIPSGKLGLNYIAEYGSSDTIRPQITGSGISVDENNGNSINVGLFARPGGLPGFQMGGSFYHDKISDFARGPGIRLGQTIVNGHVIYVARGIEFLNEGFLIRHSYEASSTVFNMPAFYSQLSKQFRNIRPFVRYQYINANPSSIFGDVGRRGGPSAGARYDLNENIAFKAQFDHIFRKGEPDLNGLHLQTAFTF